MTDFLADNNACGQNLLCIVSMGNSIIAEILRLKDYIPDIYRLETKSDQQKYAEIILDFSYLKITEAQEKKIEENAQLQELDDEVRENYLHLLERFYSAFESTHQYAADLKQFLDELNRGYYIQNSIESVLQDEEGKQLLCESLYLFGIMLLVLDFHIPGAIRERLIISYYRYSFTKSYGDSSIDDVCTLLRSTGYTANTSKIAATTSSKSSAAGDVACYPAAYFERFSFDQNFVDMVIGRLRCDDIYNQLSIYPHPNHRSTALSGQAAMIFICLFFSPQILHTQPAQMREIVDKFYSDNWVVSIYMGITVNLVDAWDGFRAAKAAITPVIEANAVKGFCLLHREQMRKMLQDTQEILRDGVLTDFFVLQNINKLIVLMRQCNVLLRWCFIHASHAVLEMSHVASAKAQQVVQLVCAELDYKASDLFQLLLNCSQLELFVKDILRQLMKERLERWEKFKGEVLDRVNELSEAFSGSRPLARIESNPELKMWFAEIATQVRKLNAEEPNTAGRMLIQLIQALEEVQQFHNLQSNMQVKQYLLETREYLTRMTQILNVKEDILINIQLISDLSYAWRLMDRELTPIMQESIKKQPKSLIKLRAAFLKLCSALEIPLLRINQAKSEDLISVSKYYSSELANFMRKVLQIIPETMFSILARIIQLQTEVLKEIPKRLDKDKLKDYVQFEERYEVAKLTNSIAVFTEGVHMMKTTLVGVLELDPKQLLEDGIRKELVRNLANALNVGLIFTPATSSSSKTKHNGVAELSAKLLALSKVMDGYQRSFEYVQDYLNIDGLKLLQEELQRVINYNVEQECNAFLRNKIKSWQSQYQSQTIPIPSFPPVQGENSNANNFIGRLANEILLCTDPKHTIFMEMKATWYDKQAPHKEVLNARNFFSQLREAICPVGLVGLDRLYTHQLVADMKRNVQKLHHNFTHEKMWSDALRTLTAELESKDFPNVANGNPSNPLKYYQSYHMRWLKVWPTLLQWILDLGHKQIVRQQLSFELNRSCKCHAKNLESSLDTFNRALLHELEAVNGDGKFVDSSREKLLDLHDYLMLAGLYEPLEQVFIITKNSHNVSLLLMLFTIAHLPRLEFSSKINAMLPKTAKDVIDGMPMIIGLLSIFQQYHQNVKMLYLTYLCQYATTLVEANINAKNEIGLEAVTALHFLECFVRTAQLPRVVLTDRIPVIVLSQYEWLATKAKN